MKNKTFLYFISAFLWLGVAFFSFFIYHKSQEEQKIETIISSSEKIDDFHQEFDELEYNWWERTELASFVHINNRYIETLYNLETSKQNSKLFKKYDKLSFSEIEPKLPKLDKYHKKNYKYAIENLISNENIYLHSELTSALYKNILLQTFRYEWTRERDYKIYEGCILFSPSKVSLNEFENHKIALYVNRVFNSYTIGYFSFPRNMEEGIFTDSKKEFEFEMTVRTVGRNPTTTIKRYRITPKEGQELKSFDYEEIE